MELGLNFDDEDLVEEKIQQPVLISYNAKICEQKWFLNPVQPDSNEDTATVWKFRADYHYSQAAYEPAIECYHQSLECMGSHNRTMRREIMESLARCSLNSGEIEKAKEYSSKMMDECLTSAQFCQGLLLQHQIYKTTGMLKEELLVLHQLIQLHSFHYPFWLQLAQAYNRLALTKGLVQTKDKLVEGCRSHLDKETAKHKLSIGLNELGSMKAEVELIKGSASHRHELDRKVPSGQHLVNGESVQNIKAQGKNDVQYSGSEKNTRNISEEINSQPQKNVLGTETDYSIETSNDSPGCDEILCGLPSHLVQLTCLVRVKLILQSNIRSTGSFINRKNKETLEKVEKDIASLAVEGHILETVTEFMRKDMFDDDFDDNKSKEGDQQQSEVASTVSTEEFNNRWFSWIQHAS